ncbi:retrovirus-related Pol polyprotein from transposon 412 [Trichonephila clavipes]|nr:retrovirus-related Pol polyprotein from transposon 412 [Trichonephila clavipes]
MFTSSGVSWACARITENSSTIARPLHKLTEAKQKFIWTGDYDNAFNKLKDALTSVSILAHILKLGNNLFWIQMQVMRVLELCCLKRKMVRSVSSPILHFHPYLYGRRFQLRTDHASLTWLLNFKNSEGQIARWIQRIQEYDVEIRHRKGSAHGNADALSRRPCPESCKYCSRIEKKFGEIDPIVCQVTTALAPCSDGSVRKDQLADPEIKPILEFKESSDEKSSWQDIAPFHPTTKRYWALSI